MLQRPVRAPPPPPSPSVYYLPAAGCDDELNGWCNKWCPKPSGGGAAGGGGLIARRIVPTGFDKGSLKWWGCFPRAQVVDEPEADNLWVALVFSVRKRDGYIMAIYDG